MEGGKHTLFSPVPVVASPLPSSPPRSSFTAAASLRLCPACIPPPGRLFLAQRGDRCQYMRENIGSYTARRWGVVSTSNFCDCSSLRNLFVIFLSTLIRRQLRFPKTYHCILTRNFFDVEQNLRVSVTIILQACKRN